MTVKQLKAIIANLPDRTPILLPGSEHSYQPAQHSVTTAIFDTKSNSWSEDSGKMPLVTAYRENVLVIA